MRYFWLNFGLESKRDLNSFSCNNYKNSNIQKWSKCDVRPKETLLQLQWWTINKGSGCNAVGRAVSSAPESRSFNPAIGNFIYYQVFNRLYRIDKKEKEAWNCPYLLTMDNHNNKSMPISYRLLRLTLLSVRRKKI